MSKTPIMILQEAMAKQGILPTYEETSSTVKGTAHEFTISVKCKNSVAVGIGPNKKQAKQNAATEMLALLHVIPKKTVQALQSELPNVNLKNHQVSNTFINYVGKLNEYCALNNIPNPIYETVSITGPSHLPTITVSCTVSTTCKQASASIKMVAKHEAAKKVLEVFVKDISSLNIDSQDSELGMENVLQKLGAQLRTLKVSETKSSTNSQLNNVIERYKMTTNAIFTTEDSATIANYYIEMKILCQNICKDNLQKLIRMQSSMNSSQNIKEFKTIISQTIRKTVDETSFVTKQQGFYMCGLRLIAKPSILQIGFGRTKEEAKIKAFSNLLKYIFILQK